MNFVEDLWFDVKKVSFTFWFFLFLMLITALAIVFVIEWENLTGTIIFGGKSLDWFSVLLGLEVFAVFFAWKETKKEVKND